MNKRRPSSRAPARAATIPVPRYFLSDDWPRRLARVIAARSSTEGRDFALANAVRIRRHLTLDQSLRVVFNLGGHALLNYLRSGRYLNLYEGPIIAGVRRSPSATRLEADRLLGLSPPSDYYFCALAAGGTGIRFYGEYCVVLRPDACRAAVERVLDRNSYDLLAPPLKGYRESLAARRRARSLVDSLGGRLDDGSVQDMLVAKVLQQATDRPRLLTAGAVADAVLSDEDYCEAYHRGRIEHAAIEEIRENPADVAREGEIVQRVQGGEAVTTAELVWALRRRLVRRNLARCGIARTLVADGGRTARWS